jgi:Protein of unknown function (DUF1275)
MSARNGSKAPARVTAIEAFLLAGVGGSVDAIGVLTLGRLFVAHMSGNSAALWGSLWPWRLADRVATPFRGAGLSHRLVCRLRLDLD